MHTPPVPGVRPALPRGSLVALLTPFTDDLRAGITCLPGNVLVLRVLGHDMETVRGLLVSHWLTLRPLVHGVPAEPLRLWAT